MGLDECVGSVGFFFLAFRFSKTNGWREGRNWNRESGWVERRWRRVLYGLLFFFLFLLWEECVEGNEGNATFRIRLPYVRLLDKPKDTEHF